MIVLILLRILKMLQKRFFQRVSLLLFGLICYICIYLLLQAREESIDFGKRARVYNVHYYPNKNYPMSYLQYECVKSKLSGCGGKLKLTSYIMPRFSCLLISEIGFSK